MKVHFEGESREMHSLWMEGTEIKFIDQRLLPHKLEIFSAKNVKDVAFAIKDMVVRGAPAIGAAAALGMAQAKIQKEDRNKVANILRETRPTAQDLFTALDFMLKKIEEGADPKEAAKDYIDNILNKCRKIGEHGETLIKDDQRILTHCNAGALATVDYGTALSPIRLAHRGGKNIFVFVDETRPRLQGARLTAWELLNEGIPHALIADNAAGDFMQRGEIDMVIVGADRITQNGDFANKIGTYEKAVLAYENHIPFYVAAPITTFDFSLANGSAIPIEERSQEEVLKIGSELIAPSGTKARNPAFDVTFAKYVTGYITETGVFKAEEISSLKSHAIR
ncbi:MAG: S-methyl-5-thioribose-1-phosphate isomerase [Methanomassiliicoccales archaeon]|nr:MAG: S-methyl-5-thioribose-1-phosphate isomerase [Methanomassiliicoccales archaeon]